MEAAPETPGATLARLIGEATAALARLDAEQLELLAAQARALTPADLRVALPELQARMRVFSSVLAATGANVMALERAQSRVEMWGHTQDKTHGRAATFGYADEVFRGSDWTRAQIAPASALRQRAGRTA